MRKSAWILDVTRLGNTVFRAMVICLPLVGCGSEEQVSSYGWGGKGEQDKVIDLTSTPEFKGPTEVIHLSDGEVRDVHMKKGLRYVVELDGPANEGFVVHWWSVVPKNPGVVVESLEGDVFKQETIALAMPNGTTVNKRQADGCYENDPSRTCKPGIYLAVCASPPDIRTPLKLTTLMLASTSAAGIVTVGGNKSDCSSNDALCKSFLELNPGLEEFFGEPCAIEGDVTILD